jgi:hypothetical protein
MGRLVNLLREEAEEVTVRKSVEIPLPIRATIAFVPALKKAGPISS